MEKASRLLSSSTCSPEDNNCSSTNIDHVEVADEEDADTAAPVTPEMQAPVSADPSTSNEDVCPACNAKQKCPTPTDVDEVIVYFQEKKEHATKKDDLDLFFMSLCQSTEALSCRMQNNLKKDFLEILVRAQEQEEMETLGYAPSPLPSPCGDT
ncbi:hypothetical protein SK128_016246 [Halocaridina rubra]|uniref:Uncharacterized protein n=1 Tax=Halocaridina rubra TaxID=373956 RepID=A0AAN8WHE6_HALRR